MNYAHYLVRLTFDIDGLIGREVFELHAAGHVQAAAVAGVQLGYGIAQASMETCTLAEFVAGMPVENFRIRLIEFFRVEGQGDQEP